MSHQEALTLAAPSRENKSHFADIPWASKLFNDPALQPFNTNSRVIKGTSTADTFCARTLATGETIIAWQSFLKPVSPPNKFGEVIALLKLGSGLNGHVDTCHGGFLCVLMDEMISFAADNEKPKDKTTMTAYLKVDYKKPV